MKIKKFQLTPKKKIKLRYYGPFVANSGIIAPIQVDEYFYDLSSNAQKAVIWHELYHRKNMVGFLRVWWSLKSIFTKENPR